MGKDAWNLILPRLDDLRCPNCPGDCNVVPSDGPYQQVQCDYAFIGEAPGRDEDANGRPFIGRAGKEFNEHYLPLAGLSRSAIYLTNTRKCKPPNNRTPKPNEVASCSNHFLPLELETVQPELIVLMGGTAASLVDTPDDPVDLEVCHGRPRIAQLFGDLYRVFFTYHPALGLHDSTKIRVLRQDFQNLRKYIDSGYTYEWSKDEHEGKEHYLLLGSDNLAADYCRAVIDRLGYLHSQGKEGARTAGIHTPAQWIDTTVATDTESVGWKLWSWQLSIEPGVSVMGMMDDREGVKLYAEMLAAAGNVVMHNAQHDKAEQVRDGIDVPWWKITDTMQMAYRLGESQGLKALAGRHCGMKMKSYMETVKPYSLEYVRLWLDCVLESLPELQVEYVTPKKRERKTKMVKNPATTLFNRLSVSMARNPEYDPWKAWGRQLGNLALEVDGIKPKTKKTLDVEKSLELNYWVEWVKDEIGDIPAVGLDKVPVAVAKWYACRDSDANLRVYRVLDEMERAFGKNVKG